MAPTIRRNFPEVCVPSARALNLRQNIRRRRRGRNQSTVERPPDSRQSDCAGRSRDDSSVFEARVAIELRVLRRARSGASLKYAAADRTTLGRQIAKATCRAAEVGTDSVRNYGFRSFALRTIRLDPEEPGSWLAVNSD